MTQTARTFDKASLIKTLKGAGIAGAGVALLYLLEWLASLDFGIYTALATGLLAVAVNFIREWYKGDIRVIDKTMVDENETAVADEPEESEEETEEVDE